MSGDIFGAVNSASDIRVLKVFPNGNGKAFTVAIKAEEIADETIALYGSDNKLVTGTIDPAETHYTLVAYVRDGGEFDLNGKADARVVDPIAIIRLAEAPKDRTPEPTTSTGGGGCSTGAGGSAIIAIGLALAVIRRRSAA